MRTFRGTHALAVGIVTVVALAAACVPPPGPPPTTTTTTTIATPTPPVITSFDVVGGVGPAPTLVALSWTVSDPNGDALTCRFDGDGDGIDDVVIENCGGTRSRTVALDAPGSYTARLSVSDATFEPVTALRSITVQAGPTETYDMVLRGVENLTPQQAAAFTEAEEYWESTILRGTPDVALGLRPPCLDAGSPSLPPVIDDLIIDVSVEPIDGGGNILGRAGPTCYSSANELPLVGVMEFDSADVANLLANGSFGAVILHEMAHVLGIGTLWNLQRFGGRRRVISGAGGPYPAYFGTRAVAEYSALGASGSIPVENSGGPGTRDGHWRESVFDNELLTGYLNPGNNPVSRMTIASLADLGYQVTLDTADSYSLPGRATSLRAASLDLPGTVLRPTPAPA
jgi:hypothetical protein